MQQVEKEKKWKRIKEIGGGQASERGQRRKGRGTERRLEEESVDKSMDDRGMRRQLSTRNQGQKVIQRWENIGKKVEKQQKRQRKTPLSLSRQSWRVRAENGFSVK